jgi:hypothetical protein
MNMWKWNAATRPTSSFHTYYNTIFYFYFFKVKYLCSIFTPKSNSYLNFKKYHLQVTFQSSEGEGDGGSEEEAAALV